MAEAGNDGFALLTLDGGAKMTSVPAKERNVVQACKYRARRQLQERAAFNGLVGDTLERGQIIKHARLLLR